jgi:hypothetical protein
MQAWRIRVRISLGMDTKAGGLQFGQVDCGHYQGMASTKGVLRLSER